jgi:hypothetical protein
MADSTQTTRGALSAWVAPDGSLQSSHGTVSWKPWRRTIRLNGLFYADRLRAIADHMDAHRVTDTLDSGKIE